MASRSSCSPSLPSCQRFSEAARSPLRPNLQPLHPLPQPHRRSPPQQSSPLPSPSRSHRHFRFNHGLPCLLQGLKPRPSFHLHLLHSQKRHSQTNPTHSNFQLSARSRPRPRPLPSSLRFKRRCLWLLRPAHHQSPTKDRPCSPGTRFRARQA